MGVTLSADSRVCLPARAGSKAALGATVSLTAQASRAGRRGLAAETGLHSRGMRSGPGWVYVTGLKVRCRLHPLWPHPGAWPTAVGHRLGSLGQLRVGIHLSRPTFGDHGICLAKRPAMRPRR